MNKGGRPSKYSDSMLEKAEDYIINCPNVIPSAAGMASVLGVVKSTLYEWGHKHEKFSVMLEKLNQTQELRLLDGGLGGDMNATICKLVLSKHDYSDKVETNNENSTDIHIKVSHV